MNLTRALLVAVLALGLMPSAAAGVELEGAEFQVNTYTTSNQYPDGARAVARSSDGRFVVVWTSFSQDGNDAGIFAQRFQSTGATKGSEFQVNSYTTGAQLAASVVRAADGSFVVVWSSLGQDGSGYGVFGQRYDTTGAAAGSEFQINDYTTGDQQRAVAAVDGVGNFLVAWSGEGSDDASVGGVLARRYAASGAAIDSEFQVNSFTTGEQSGPAVAIAADGALVLVWTSDGQDGSGSGIFAQRYDSTGAAAGAEFQINEHTTSTQQHPDVALSSPAGDFVIVWSELSGTDGDGSGISGRRFDSTGAALGGDFQVNVYTTDTQRQAAVASDGDDGTFVVVWESYLQSDSSYEVIGQEFDSTAAPVGDEFQANTYTTGNQYALPQLATDGLGNFVVAWRSPHDGSGFGTFIQRVCTDGDDDLVCDDDDACEGFDDAADADSDTVPDGCDVCPGNDDLLDADDDTIPDACDTCPDDADNDVDEDGVCGDVDNCPAVSNSAQDNADGDGLGDACDACPIDPDNDIDEDGVCGDVDNCPTESNSAQNDSDGDGVGNKCDICAGSDDNIDTDGDTVPDGCDACEGFDDLLDADADAIPDDCDACPVDPDNDGDSDGVCGDVDNCPTDSNAGQLDEDEDGNGDACDLCPGFDDGIDADADTVPDLCDACPGFDDFADDDGDTVADDCDLCPGFDDFADGDGDAIPDDCDNCPAVSNSAQDNADGDGLGDACDACPNDADNDIDLDGVCGDVDNCPTEFNSGQADDDGDGAGNPCDVCQNDADDDADGDSLCADVDNCPVDNNPGQQDVDNDDVGDACDACPGFDDALDADSDTVPDACDVCAGFDDTADADGDAIPDDCDSCPNDPNDDIDGDGLCADVDNCPNDDNAGQEDLDGDDVGDACDDCRGDELAGIPCSDGDLCNGTEECDGNGVCLTGTGTPLDCDDNDVCTQDSCTAAVGCVYSGEPAATCRTPLFATIKLFDDSGTNGDSLTWTWSRGEETSHADFGDPSLDATYTLCVYDTTAEASTLALSLEVDPNPVWEDKDPKGWLYKDSTGSRDGVQTLQLTPGDDGLPKFKIVAKGENLALPGAAAIPKYFDQDPVVTAQLVKTDGSPLCWSSEFTEFTQNAFDQYKATQRAPTELGPFEVTECGQEYPGTAFLTSDLDCTGHDYGVIMLADTFSLGGFTISGATIAGVSCIGARCRIFGPGAIDGNGAGVISSARTDVFDVTISNNAGAGIDSDGHGSVDTSIVTGNGGRGVRLAGDRGKALIIDSIISDNQSGVLVDQEVPRIVIKDSVLNDNEDSALLLVAFGSAKCKGCEMKGNGIAVEASGSTVRLVRSDISDNIGDGARGRRVRVSKSTISGNGGTGLLGGFMKVSRSTVNANGQYGIDGGIQMVVKDVTALGNGTDLACATTLNCADIASTIEPKFSDVVCETSVQLLADVPVGTWGVCSLD